MVYSSSLATAGTYGAGVVAVLHFLFFLLEYFPRCMVSLEKQAGTVPRGAKASSNAGPGRVEVCRCASVFLGTTSFLS